MSPLNKVKMSRVGLRTLQNSHAEIDRLQAVQKITTKQITQVEPSGNGSFVIDIDKDPMHYSINKVGSVMGIKAIAEFSVSDTISDNCLLIFKKHKHTSLFKQKNYDFRHPQP